MTIKLDSDAYECFSYPAGELQVRLNQDTVTALEKDHRGVDIEARNLANPNRMMELVLLVDALRGIGHHELSLVIPYLPYGRADRRFLKGDCHGLKSFGTVINSLGFASVYTLDAHNEEAACSAIENLTYLSPERYINEALNNWATPLTTDDPSVERLPLTVILPDKGAMDRYDVSPSLYRSVIIGNKKRDPETGLIISYEIDLHHSPYMQYLVVDDLCDGGATFNLLASNLHELGVKRENLALYVTHGIFSRGVQPLLNNFGHIFCTDSFKTLDCNHVTQYKFNVDDYFAISKQVKGENA